MLSRPASLFLNAFSPILKEDVSSGPMAYDFFFPFAQMNQGCYNVSLQIK